MCFFPTYRYIRIKDPNSFFGTRTVLIQCSCGKCVQCLNKRVRDWSFRAFAECLSCGYANVVFLTLTYDDEHLSLHENLKDYKEDFQRFMKRLRKYCDKKFNRKIRYICTTEFGELRGRIHRHALIFNLPFDYQNPEAISRLWRNGFVKLKQANFRRVRYVLKYIMNPCVASDKWRYFFLFSRRPGLGSGIINKVKKYVSQSVDKKGMPPTYFPIDGYMYPIPRYYRNKVFSEAQRGQLLEAAVRYANEAKHKHSIRVREQGWQAVTKKLKDLYNENDRLLNKYKCFDKIKMIKVRSHYEYIYKSSPSKSTSESI